VRPAIRRGSLIAALVQGAAIGTMVQELTVVDGRYADAQPPDEK
jgi:hypothetical protein